MGCDESEAQFAKHIRAMANADDGVFVTLVRGDDKPRAITSVWLDEMPEVGHIVPLNINGNVRNLVVTDTHETMKNPGSFFAELEHWAACVEAPA